VTNPPPERAGTGRISAETASAGERNAVHLAPAVPPTWVGRRPSAPTGPRPASGRRGKRAGPPGGRSSASTGRSGQLRCGLSAAAEGFGPGAAAGAWSGGLVGRGRAAAGPGSTSCAVMGRGMRLGELVPPCARWGASRPEAGSRWTPRVACGAVSDRQRRVPLRHLRWSARGTRDVGGDPFPRRRGRRLRSGRRPRC
jgi:hypothetical protein